MQKTTSAGGLRMHCAAGNLPTAFPTAGAAFAMRWGTTLSNGIPTKTTFSGVLRYQLRIVCRGFCDPWRSICNDVKAACQLAMPEKIPHIRLMCTSETAAHTGIPMVCGAKLALLELSRKLSRCTLALQMSSKSELLLDQHHSCDARQHLFGSACGLLGHQASRFYMPAAPRIP